MSGARSTIISGPTRQVLLSKDYITPTYILLNQTAVHSIYHISIEIGSVPRKTSFATNWKKKTFGFVVYTAYFSVHSIGGQ